MVVDLPDPEEPTSAVTVSGSASNETSWSTGFPVSYSNDTRSNSTWPLWVRARRALGILVLARFISGFAGALESRQRLGNLGADSDHLGDRRNQEAQEYRERDEPAGGQRAAQNLPAANVHDQRADHTQQSVADKLSTETPVNDFKTLARIRSAPFWKTASSRASA